MSTAPTRATGLPTGQMVERLRAMPKPALIVGGALIVALIIALALWTRAPEYRVLYTQLNERDGGAIMNALTQMNVPYRFSDGGGALLVPADKVHEARLQLASQGLPRGGSVGFELLDEGRFGASQFTEQVNYQRALEGELARSIESMQAVQSARVHLALPRQSLFVRDRQPPTASVLVQLFPGRTLDAAQVAAIAHLVSSSVPDLTLANISIVDQMGRLLTSPEGDGMGMDANQFRQVRDLEQHYVRRIEAILTPILGPGNVHAQINLDLDFARREVTSESYRPNQEPGQAAVRSQQTSSEVDGTSRLARGVPGALTNQPPVDPTAPLVNPPPAAGQPPQEGLPAEANPGQAAMAAAGLEPGAVGSERHDATTNYEVDRTIRHIQEAVGGISRMTAAVVVNHRPDANGDPQPLDEAQLEQLRQLVRETIGFSAERGDSLNLVNSAFAVITPPEPAWWENPRIIDLAKSIGSWMIGVFLILWLWLGLIRPQMQRRNAAPTVSPAQRQLAEAEEAETERKLVAAARERQKSRYEDNLQTARELALKDPRAVAAVLRGWMEKND